MKNRKVSAAAVIAAGLSTVALGLASPADAACASIGAGLTIGNASQCSATFGNVAVVLDDVGTARVLGGIGNSAFAWGIGSAAVVGNPLGGDQSLNFFNTSLAGGTYANALTTGIGNGAADIGDNDAPTIVQTPFGPRPVFAGQAIAVGSLNRVVNVGGNNIGVAANLPNLETLQLGGNTVFNWGKGNVATAGRVLEQGPFFIPAPDDETNWSSAISIGNLNKSVVTGNNSGAIAVGEGRIVQPKYESIIPPVKQYNRAYTGGNGSLSAAVGQWNNASVSGNFSGANATGTGSTSTTNADGSMAGTFGDGSESRVTGNNSLATVFGNGSHARALVKSTLAAVFGNKSDAEANKPGAVAAAVGDNKEAENEVK